MKRLLICTGGYLPGKNYGGPVVSISNFVELLGSEFEIFIVTKNHDLNTNEPYENIKSGWNQIGKARVLYLKDSEINTVNLNYIVNNINPDLIYQNSFFASKFVLPLLRIAKKQNRKLLIAPRGEFFYNALKQKAYKKYLYMLFVRLFLIRKNIFIHATIEEEVKLIRRVLCFPIKKIFRLENIPTLPSKLYKKGLKKEGSLKLIYLARIHPTKNLIFALECLKKIKGDVTLDIFGNIENLQYWEKCNCRINAFRLPGSNK
ncbi:hypothetical protein HUN92_22235 [Bacillus firmus]|uniref:hypothetical protein n=1 Tax=Cytobacillus firmus TaxID=1399 RepID=UPI00157FF504|nr:hypothetical protein [Cytobacillus firmus]NUH86360.1 hypothetical protein [Cytobacillus firmus]